MWIRHLIIVTQTKAYANEEKGKALAIMLILVNQMLQNYLGAIRLHVNILLTTLYCKLYIREQRSIIERISSKQSH